MSNNLFDQTDKHDTSEDKREDFDFGEFFFSYFQYWRWFIASIILFVAIGGLVYLSISKKYEVSTSILLKEDKGGAGSTQSALNGLESLGLITTTNNVDNEVAVFSSPNLIRQVVDTLKLYTNYFQKGTFRNTDVYTSSPYEVILDGITSNKLKGGIELNVSYQSKDKVKISGVYTYESEDHSIESGEYKLPCAINLPTGKGRIIVDFRKESPETTLASLDDSYIITIGDIQGTVNNIASVLSVSATSKNSSVLDISMKLGNPRKGVDFLTQLASIYNSNNVYESNEIARNTAHFINERLIDISSELKNIEEKVVSYKQKKGLTDIDTEAKVYIGQAADIESKRVEAETQTKLVQMVDNYINNDANKNKLIPNISINDPGLSLVISDYNNQLLAYERLERSTGENNPTRVRMEATLKNMRQNIQSAVLNVKKAIAINNKDLASQSGLLASRKSSMPDQEYGLAEILRQQQVIQAIYIYLMQTREESNITLAATSDKAQVITDPVAPNLPVSPRRNLILAVFLFLGFAVPVIVIYLKNLLNTTISNRQELEHLADPSVIGEIMRKEEPENLVVKYDSTSPIVELFRTLRNNLQFILADTEKKVIIVTSTIPNEGKSFVSINLAASFALSEKRVLLLGLDIRNPQLAMDMDFKKGKGVTSVLAGDEKWEDLLTKVPGYPNLDILQAGVIPPNPNELLMRKELGDMIGEIRQKYDYIIIDTAPVGVVSDTFLIAKHVDASVYVTRENATPKSAVTYINSLYKEKRLPNHYLVINDVDVIKNSKKYGYRYRYGYGYSYGYGYGPNHSKKKKK